MYNYTNCPVCKGQKFSTHLNCKDHTVSKEEFTIVSCDSCGFKFTNPIPDIADLGDYYKSENYISHSNTKKGIVSRLYHMVRNYTLKKKLALVSANVSRGTIMDYGCGTGMFLDVCQEAGWRAFGMEPDAGARKIAKDMKLKVYKDKTELETSHREEKIDAITLWHVLEHVTDLEETLTYFKQKLSKDGVLIIAVPNYTSYDARHYKEFWAAYDVPRHLYHFNIDSVSTLLSNHGFTLESTLPMKFDSFYVSMLSEKYKTGSLKLLSAFVTGLKSNFKAKAASNYSSVIYVFKHK
ncbi:class I SAM-dependent methyltransferase [Aurantibacillus circumpalustris]|uniref:class I SAM-dependent methyltransferase n=1 Tax=Aurantibacillus circumpalustris TaxID=3036359 RepID=UPI00295AE335|nr:class I SAM-dependent methyltransferase [Aurantibacillus circumpalustris]